MVFSKRILILLAVVVGCALLVGYSVRIPALRRGVTLFHTHIDRIRLANSDSATSACSDRVHSKDESQDALHDSTAPVYAPNKLINVLKSEIARYHEQGAQIEQKIREDEIHVQLLVNRGYEADSPEVIQRINERNVRQSELKRTEEQARGLQERLRPVERAMKEEKESAYPHASNRILEREWYMWLQNNSYGDEDLLQLDP